MSIFGTLSTSTSGKNLNIETAQIQPCSEINKENIELREIRKDHVVKITSVPFDTTEKKTPSYGRYLAISNKYGYIVACQDYSIFFLYTKDVYSALQRKSESSLLNGEIIDTNSVVISKIESSNNAIITHISITGSEDMIIVATSTNHVYLFKAADLAKGNAQPTMTTKLNSVLVDLKPNPDPSSSTVALLLSNKSVKIFNTTDPSATTALGDLTDATSICWSRKGKQIAVGTSGGAIKTLTTAGVVKRIIKVTENNSDDKLAVLFLSWLDDQTFLTVCGSEFDIGQTANADFNDIDYSHQFKVYIATKVDKNSSLQILEIDDPCLPWGLTNRGPMRYSAELFGYGQDNDVLLFMSASASTDIASIGKSLNPGNYNEKIWSLLNLPETMRASLSFSKYDSNNDTAPLGMCIDKTSNISLPPLRPDESDTPIPPVPVLWVLTTDGCLLCYHILNTIEAEKNQRYSGMIETVEPLIGSSKIANMEITNNPTSTSFGGFGSALSNNTELNKTPSAIKASFSQAQAKIPQPSSFGAPSFGAPAFGASSFGTSTFGQSAFGQSNSSTSAFGQGNSSTSAFGQGNSSTSAFGQGNSSTSAFGQSNSSSAPIFGQSNLSSTSAFGNKEVSKPVVFGAPSTESQKPAFGSLVPATDIKFGSFSSSSFGNSIGKPDDKTTSQVSTNSVFNQNATQSAFGSSTFGQATFGKSVFEKKQEPQTKTNPMINDTLQSQQSGFGSLNFGKALEKSKVDGSPLPAMSEPSNLTAKPEALFPKQPASSLSLNATKEIKTKEKTNVDSTIGTVKNQMPVQNTTPSPLSLDENELMKNHTLEKRDSSINLKVEMLKSSVPRKPASGSHNITSASLAPNTADRNILNGNKSFGKFLQPAFSDMSNLVNSSTQSKKEIEAQKRQNQIDEEKKMQQNLYNMVVKQFSETCKQLNSEVEQLTNILGNNDQLFEKLGHQYLNQEEISNPKSLITSAEAEDKVQSLNLGEVESWNYIVSQFEGSLKENSSRAESLRTVLNNLQTQSYIVEMRKDLFMGLYEKLKSKTPSYSSLEKTLDKTADGKPIDKNSINVKSIDLQSRCERVDSVISNIESILGIESEVPKSSKNSTSSSFPTTSNVSNSSGSNFILDKLFNGDYSNISEKKLSKIVDILANKVDNEIGKISNLEKQLSELEKDASLMEKIIHKSKHSDGIFKGSSGENGDDVSYQTKPSSTLYGKSRSQVRQLVPVSTHSRLRAASLQTSQKSIYINLNSRFESTRNEESIFTPEITTNSNLIREDIKGNRIPYEQAEITSVQEYLRAKQRRTRVMSQMVRSKCSSLLHEVVLPVYKTDEKETEKKLEKVHEVGSVNTNNLHHVGMNSDNGICVTKMTGLSQNPLKDLHDRFLLAEKEKEHRISENQARTGKIYSDGTPVNFNRNKQVPTPKIDKLLTPIAASSENRNGLLSNTNTNSEEVRSDKKAFNTGIFFGKSKEPDISYNLPMIDKDISLPEEKFKDDEWCCAQCRSFNKKSRASCHGCGNFGFIFENDTSSKEGIQMGEMVDSSSGNVSQAQWEKAIHSGKPSNIGAFGNSTQKDDSKNFNLFSSSAINTLNLEDDIQKPATIFDFGSQGLVSVKPKNNNLMEPNQSQNKPVSGISIPKINSPVANLFSNLPAKSKEDDANQKKKPQSLFQSMNKQDFDNTSSSFGNSFGSSPSAFTHKADTGLDKKPLSFGIKGFSEPGNNENLKKSIDFSKALSSNSTNKAGGLFTNNGNSIVSEKSFFGAKSAQNAFQFNSDSNSSAFGGGLSAFGSQPPVSVFGKPDVGLFPKLNSNITTKPQDTSAFNVTREHNASEDDSTDSSASEHSDNEYTDEQTDSDYEPQGSGLDYTSNSENEELDKIGESEVEDLFDNENFALDELASSLQENSIKTDENVYNTDIVNQDKKEKSPSTKPDVGNTNESRTDISNAFGFVKVHNESILNHTSVKNDSDGISTLTKDLETEPSFKLDSETGQKGQSFSNQNSVSQDPSNKTPLSSPKISTIDDTQSSMVSINIPTPSLTENDTKDEPQHIDQEKTVDALDNLQEKDDGLSKSVIQEQNISDSVFESPGRTRSISGSMMNIRLSFGGTSSTSGVSNMGSNTFSGLIPSSNHPNPPNTISPRKTSISDSQHSLFSLDQKSPSNLDLGKPTEQGNRECIYDSNSLSPNRLLDFADSDLNSNKSEDSGISDTGNDESNQLNDNLKQETTESGEKGDHRTNSNLSESEYSIENSLKPDGTIENKHDVKDASNQGGHENKAKTEIDLVNHLSSIDLAEAKIEYHPKTKDVDEIPPELSDIESDVDKAINNEVIEPGLDNSVYEKPANEVIELEKGDINENNTVDDNCQTNESQDPDFESTSGFVILDSQPEELLSKLLRKSNLDGNSKDLKVVATENDKDVDATVQKELLAATENISTLTIDKKPLKKDIDEIENNRVDIGNGGDETRIGDIKNNEDFTRNIMPQDLYSDGEIDNHPVTAFDVNLPEKREIIKKSEEIDKIANQGEISDSPNTESNRFEVVTSDMVESLSLDGDNLDQISLGLANTEISDKASSSIETNKVEKNPAHHETDEKTSLEEELVSDVQKPDSGNTSEFIQVVNIISKPKTEGDKDELKIEDKTIENENIQEKSLKTLGKTAEEKVLSFKSMESQSLADDVHVEIPQLMPKVSGDTEPDMDDSSEDSFVNVEPVDISQDGDQIVYSYDNLTDQKEDMLDIDSIDKAIKEIDMDTETPNTFDISSKAESSKTEQQNFVQPLLPNAGFEAKEPGIDTIGNIDHLQTTEFKSSSVFSQPSFSQSSFGAQNNGDTNSGFGQPSFSQPSFAQPAFGQSTFGQPAFGKPTFGQSGFGTQASSSTNSGLGSSGPVFGQSAFGRGNNQPASFGSLSSSQSAFGSVEQGKTTFGATSVFGKQISSQKTLQDSENGKPSAFGSTSSVSQPIQDNSGSSSGFGQSTFGQPAFGKPTFGQSGFGTQASSSTNSGLGSSGPPTFGQSGFGTQASSSTNSGLGSSGPVFGQSAFGRGNNQPASFGSLSSSQSAFGSVEQGKTTFGATSVFGKQISSQKTLQDSENGKPSAFGSTSSVSQPIQDNSGSSSGFGQSTFGQPAFGKPTFGQSGFGTQASSSTNSGLGSSGPVFGQSAFGQGNSQPASFGSLGSSQPVFGAGVSGQGFGQSSFGSDKSAQQGGFAKVAFSSGFSDIRGKNAMNDDSDDEDDSKSLPSVIYSDEDI
ncbi:hypothetical protein BB558_002737 [Smittium angustum]|uniref:RanBP2-type domain-containing protein n=1 Tax=Smittium angustum TaxID=133377 RepID=A0A2U1J7S2_SMIAN|nr:hypothetical protein BB558_002737 [Smittium angustum]